MTVRGWVYWLVGIGYVVYANSLFNGFVLDDLFQIVNNPNLHPFSLYFFFHEIGPFYRPLMLESFGILHGLFGEQAFFYHLWQVSLHITNAVLVFFLFQKLLKKQTIAFFLALVFLIHPINTEAVVYASELQEVYFLLFGLTSLLLLLYKPLTRRSMLLILGLQLVSLLSKETGFLFCVMAVVISVWYLRQPIRMAAVFVLPIIVYVAMRVWLVGEISTNKYIITIPHTSLTASLAERMINMPHIFWFYLSTFFYPKDLAILQYWWDQKITWNSFYLPLMLDGLFLFLLLVGGVWLWRKKRQAFTLYSLFVVWFFLGISVHLQLFPLDGTVAERWFYFPIIGLLGILGIMAQQVHVRSVNIRWALWLLIGLGVLSWGLRTMLRNTDWYTPLTLYQHDVRISTQSADLEYNLGVVLLADGKVDQAISHLKRAEQLAPNAYMASEQLGRAYLKKQKYAEAIAQFQNAIAVEKRSAFVKVHDGDLAITYTDLATAHVLALEPEKAKVILTRLLKENPHDATAWHILAFAEYLVGDHKRAYRDFEKAYKLDPDEINTYNYEQTKVKGTPAFRL